MNETVKALSQRMKDAAGKATVGNWEAHEQIWWENDPSGDFEKHGKNREIMTDDESEKNDGLIIATVNGCIGQQGLDNAAHIALCSPANVTALIEGYEGEIERLTQNRDQWERNSSTENRRAGDCSVQLRHAEAEIASLRDQLALERELGDSRISKIAGLLEQLKQCQEGR